MNEIIRKRKSIRKFNLEPLDEATLEMVKEQIETLKPLYRDIQYSIDITSKTKGLMNIKAPHYLVLRSEEKDGHLENIGFIGQQMDLFFSATGLGSCWLGATKPEKRDAGAMQCIICIAFGKPSEPLHRSLAEFKRKPLSEMSEGDDERLEAARLAPSAVNMQNWFFVAENGKIHCYRKKPNPLLGFIYTKLGCLDMGIALCHIAEESTEFCFEQKNGIPERKGHVYMGTVQESEKAGM